MILNFNQFLYQLIVNEINVLHYNILLKINTQTQH